MAKNTYVISETGEFPAQYKVLKLGDNGVYILSFILGYSVIKNYNFDKSIYVEEIIIILLIPILDMIRLFITRTIFGKNPFKPDATHLHHIVQRNYGAKKLIY